MTVLKHHAKGLSNQNWFSRLKAKQLLKQQSFAGEHPEPLALMEAKKLHRIQSIENSQGFHGQSSHI